MADNYLAKQYERYEAKKAEIAKKKMMTRARALNRYKKKLEQEALLLQQKKESEKTQETENSTQES